MSSRPIILSILLLVVAAAGAWVWRMSTAEPMSAFRDFPWTYISEAACGSDETRVIIDRGQITGPPTVVDETGATAWPAFIHPNAAVVPLINGKPCIFPLIPNGNGSRTPVIKSLGRPLTQKEIDGALRYQIPEGRERLDVFRKEMGL